MKNASECLAYIKAYDGPPLRLMEVCGTHTNSVFRYGIRDILPPSVSLISGPGCPVCVTPATYIDAACRLSLRENSVLCAFGDMIRVPGSAGSLASARAEGGRVKIVYSPMEVLKLAENEPNITFYMTAVGFETTLPIYALMLRDALEKNIRNIRLLTAVKAIVPAMRWICAHEHLIDGFIGPGHVSTIIGADAYLSIASEFGVPVSIAGFEYEHLLAALCDLIGQCREGKATVRNLYPNAVASSGNPEALRLIDRYFTKQPSVWRGLGAIDGSGYGVRSEFEAFDAVDWESRAGSAEPPGCLCGKVIIGRAEPTECGLFGQRCTPADPVGPCMVSSEGACGIYYKNKRLS